MSADAKKLGKGEIRFVVKKIDAKYRVYDRAGGSFPYRTGELGIVVQDVTETEAQAEADRLNEQFVGQIKATPVAPVKTVQAPIGNREAGDLPPTPLGRKAKSKKSGPPPDAEVSLFKEAEWVDESEIGDYGDLSDKTDGYVDWKQT